MKNGYPNPMKDLNTMMRILAILCVVLAMTSCSSNENLIVGKWQEVGSEGYMEFFEDGTYESKTYIQGQGLEGSGSYQFLEDGRLRTNSAISGPGVHPFFFNVSIEGDELTMINVSNDNGITLVYKKFE